MGKTEKGIEQLIINYLTKKASPEDVDKLNNWIEESSENYQYYQQTRNIWEMTHPAFNPEDININSAHEKIMQKLQQKKWYVTMYTYWQKVAAILLLPLLIFSTYYIITTNQQEPPPITYQEIFAPYGTHSTVNLPDGSIVWLNAGSSIKYPTVFTSGNRDVYLTGEAYFEVQSDTKNPFYVHLDKVKVRATGTAFNIEAYKHDSLIAVTLIEGKVDITIGNNQSFDLLPGERMGYYIGSARCEVIKTDTYKWYAWKDGTMVFRDDPLEYVFKKIGKTFNVHIDVNPEIANFPYRATFKEEPLDEILRLLKLSAPINYKKSDRKMTENGEYIKQTIEVFGTKRKK